MGAVGTIRQKGDAVPQRGPLRGNVVDGKVTFYGGRSNLDRAAE